jgi:hypothetical protein
MTDVYSEIALRLQHTRCADPTHEPHREAKDGYLLESECTTCLARSLKDCYLNGHYDGTRV